MHTKLADKTIYWTGNGRDVDAFEREVVDGLNGAFVLFTGGSLPARAYLDSGGQIPLVYDEDERKTGLSAHDLLDPIQYEERLDQERISRFIYREGRGGWIAGTLTAHRGVKRLLPNHYLDLATFTTRRHWPLPTVRHDLSLEAAASRVQDALRGYVESVARNFSAAITLTAGFDSRLLLAASRHVKDRLSFITMSPKDVGVDQVVSRELARVLDLQHRLVPVIGATSVGELAWDRLVGHAIREVNRRTYPTLATISEELILTGMYGETGRCRLYRQDVDTIDDHPPTAHFIIGRLTLPADEVLVTNIEEWLAPIRHLPRSMVLDLAFNELKFGSWAMGQAPIQKAMKMSLAPFAQRVVLDAFMRVPPVERGTSALFKEIGMRLWPKAMELPINAYGDWRDKMAPFLKLLSAERVRRFLRDRLARA